MLLKKKYLAHLLQTSVNEVVFNPPDLTSDLQRQWEIGCQLLDHGYPLDYLLGYVDILNIHLKIDSSVLIPRPETEYWLQAIGQELLPELIDESTLLTDIGTGSGLIAIYLNKIFTTNQIIASDISSQSLQIAIENARLNQSSKQLNFALGHGLQVVELESKVNNLAGHNWILISNPPYVPSTDKSMSTVNKINFEPEIAIYSGLDGLEMFDCLLQQMQNLSLPKACIFELDPRNIQLAEQKLQKLRYKTDIWIDQFGLDRLLIGKLKQN